MKFTLEQALTCYDETGINILNGDDKVRQVLNLKMIKRTEYFEGLEQYSAVLDKDNTILTSKLETKMAKECAKYATSKMAEIRNIDNELYMCNQLYVSKIKKYFDIDNKLSSSEFMNCLSNLLEDIGKDMNSENTTGDKAKKK